MKINEVTKKVEPSKPRNFVAKNATTSGAGAHKDKKKEAKQGNNKHKGKEIDMSEDDMKIKAVSGNDVTIDQGGQEIKTTTDALAPGATPGSFTMKPADPNEMKPGATVTSDTETTEDQEEDVMAIAPDDQHIHAETDPDLIGSGHNIDIGGDATDSFINQVRDKDFERAQRGGREGFAGRKKMSENDELIKMLTIAGLK
jgi:hypothetical protein